MPTNYGFFNEYENSPGFRESVEFIKDLDEEEDKYISSELRNLLIESNFYFQLAKALYYEKGYLPQYLLNKFICNADDKDNENDEEVDEMERL